MKNEKTLRSILGVAVVGALMERARLANFVFYLAVLAPIAMLTATANAWFEGTSRPRAASPSGTGCVVQTSSMNHTDSAEEPLIVWNRAVFQGMTLSSGGTGCANPPPADASKLFGAEFQNYLVVLISDSPTEDAYYWCNSWSTDALWTDGTEILHTFEFASAPCGAGYYALISCMTASTILYNPGWSEGYFTPASFSQCNVTTPDWHPIGVPGVNGTNHGPPVNLNL